MKRTEANLQLYHIHCSKNTFQICPVPCAYLHFCKFLYKITCLQIVVPGQCCKLLYQKCFLQTLLPNLFCKLIDIPDQLQITHCSIRSQLLSSFADRVPLNFSTGSLLLHITVLDHEENRSAFKELLSLIVQESLSPSQPTKQRCSQGMERAITRHLHHHHLYHHHLQGSQQNRVVVKEWTEQSLRDRQDQQQSRITQQDQPRGQQLSLSLASHEGFSPILLLLE